MRLSGTDQAPTLVDDQVIACSGVDSHRAPRHKYVVGGTTGDEIRGPPARAIDVVNLNVDELRRRSGSALERCAGGAKKLSVGTHSLEILDGVHRVDESAARDYERLADDHRVSESVASHYVLERGDRLTGGVDRRGDSEARGGGLKRL